MKQQIEGATRNKMGKLYEFFYLQGTGAEVGVQYGLFSNTIANDWSGNIICVDKWESGEVFEVAKHTLNNPKFKLFRGDSVEIAKQIQDGGLDWVYIDADHHYENVLADIEAWYPKVRSGGIVSGHDYCEYLDMTVIPAVDEFCKKNGYVFYLTGNDVWNGINFATWWFIKK
jgi:hypothetical protein